MVDDGCDMVPLGLGENDEWVEGSCGIHDLPPFEPTSSFDDALIAEWQAFAPRLADHQPTLEDILDYIDTRNATGDSLFPNTDPSDSLRISTVPWRTPEDRSEAGKPTLADTAIVTDLLKPNRIGVIAAQEGTGKSFAIAELGARIARVGGSFADTWPIVECGPVMYLSEMPEEEDWEREEMVYAALKVQREALKGRYFREYIHDIANGSPLTDQTWTSNFARWARRVGLKVLFVDTATQAARIPPWGDDLYEVFARLRGIQRHVPGLAIILLLHYKKPQGRASTQPDLNSVMGEWGRPADFTVLMQSRGDDKVMLSTHKRIPHRRLLLTKRDGLLVDPIDLDQAEPEDRRKRSNEDVLRVIVDSPGISQNKLASKLDIGSSTAKEYLDELVGLELVRLGRGDRGAKTATAVPGALDLLAVGQDGDDYERTLFDSEDAA